MLIRHHQDIPMRKPIKGEIVNKPIEGEIVRKLVRESERQRAGDLVLTAFHWELIAASPK